MNSFIDTEIWSFSQKKPERTKFLTEEAYKKSLHLHESAHSFLKNQIQMNQIFMTFHQLAEIYHVLGFRGVKMPLPKLKKFYFSIFESTFITWFEISKTHLSKALKFSIKSSIHVWDYLCIIPFIEKVDVLYSCDKHFQDPSFQSLGPEIINPLDKWMLL